MPVSASVPAPRTPPPQRTPAQNAAALSHPAAVAARGRMTAQAAAPALPDDDPGVKYRNATMKRIPGTNGVFEKIGPAVAKLAKQAQDGADPEWVARTLKGLLEPAAVTFMEAVVADSAKNAEAAEAAKAEEDLVVEDTIAKTLGVVYDRVARHHAAQSRDDDFRARIRAKIAQTKFAR